MAEIKNIDMNDNEIVINLRVSRDEYELLRQNTHNLMVIPAGPNALNRTLTTGRLGNSNRIMLPKKLLEKNGVEILHKKVPAALFSKDGEAYLLIKLKDSMTGIPVFSE